MDNVNTLDHLLQIETRASALVNDAQAEADRRIHENEEKNHTLYEERYRAKVQELEASLKEEKEKIKIRYQKELDEYREEISMVDVNVESFSALLNDYLSARTGRNNA
jgi:vacuolar-type H+-ATPase subunit H